MCRAFSFFAKRLLARRSLGASNKMDSVIPSAARELISEAVEARSLAALGMTFC